MTVFTPVFPCMSLSLRAITSSTEEEDNLSLAKALKKTMKNGRSFFSGTFNVFSLSVCLCVRERDAMDGGVNEYEMGPKCHWETKRH